MSWKPKTWIGSMWIREKEANETSETLWGFPNWGSEHSHRVWNLRGSVVYDRVISGIELSIILS
ncbi:MAG: hypothetical protein HYT72_05015 [Candidatus Aenigmarchaeota archaeon]|nr:hypothetical protein [Candidatus Aenigmarchaeota archaeon]